MNPTCPKCGRPMNTGAPHGPGIGQYECRPCNVFIPFTSQRTKT